MLRIIRLYKNDVKTFFILFLKQVILRSGGLSQFSVFLNVVSTGSLQRDHREPATHVSSDSIFYKLGEHGLISFSDYIFLLTVLSSNVLKQSSVYFCCFDYVSVNLKSFTTIQKVSLLTYLVHYDLGCLARHVSSYVVFSSLCASQLST